MTRGRLFFAAVVALLAGAPLAAQTGTSLSPSTNPFLRHHPLEPGDSVAVFRAVRSRQLAFERFRRENFPTAAARHQVECDETIGRFCYNHSEELANRGAEPETVTEARLTLIAAFDTAAAWQPGDEWIAGQRIRYLVESGDFPRALSIAESCVPVSQWQCYSLAGFVQHQAGQFVAAEAFFDQALAAMPDETRCDWTNLTSLLPPGISGNYPDECEERAGANRRIWWLADPLYLVPGNERRTEHFTRQMLNLILERAESGYGIWETDLGELITRYGWPAEWENVMVGRSDNWREQAVVSRHPPSARNFVPNQRVYDNPTGARWSDWPLDQPEARARYAPAYAETFDYLEEHQVVAFRRSESSIVVAAFKWEWEGMPEDFQIDWATVLTPDDSTPMTLVTGRGNEHRVAAIMTGGKGPAVMSVEAMAPSLTRAARIRFGITPPAVPDGGLAASDILLFEPTTPLPLRVEDVAPFALTGSTVRSGSRVGLYWEIYGLTDQTDSLTTSVTVVREGRNFVQGLARGVGLGGSRRPEVTIDWTEPTGIAAFALPHSVAVELGNLRPGRYQIRVEAVSSGGRTTVSEKQIEVVE